MVFDSDFFIRHQKVLLFFLNTPLLSIFSRRFFCIDGNRSDVGNKKILRMLPDAIEWDNKNGTRSMEFITKNKFAICLYYKFYWLWYCMHLWDTVINYLSLPQYNLGFDSLTFFPQAGSGGSNVTCDGYMVRSVDPSSETLAVIRAGAGTGVLNTESTIHAAFLSSLAVSNQFSAMARMGMTFNTAALPEAIDIISAVLSLWGNDRNNGLGDIGLHICAFSPAANNVFAASDYGNFGSVSFASMAYGSLSLGAYNPFSLDSNGIAQISTTGISKFGVRSDWDINNAFTGTWGSNKNSYFRVKSADTPLTTQDPKLVVTYSTSPTVTTSSSVTDVSAFRATVSGNVTSDGGSPVTERGFVYGLSVNPTILDNKLIVDGTTGAYSGELTGLSSGTQYHFRAYATNAQGTSYGADVIFTTPAALLKPPRLTTSPSIENIRRTKVDITGDIISDGDSAITERGFTFGTSRGSLVTGQKLVVSGTDNGIFSGSLDNLLPSTRYYARAYATNSIGTGYGNEVTFITATELVQKHFFYKVFRESTYITTWSSEVISEPNFIQNINSEPGELIIHLARRFDEFNEGVDILLNNTIECWVVDDNNHRGVLLYSGYISGYKPVIEGVKEFVEITVFNNSASLSRSILRNESEETTLTYNSFDPAVILRDIIDKFRSLGGQIKYTSTSIMNTGYLVSYTFNTNTMKECFDKILELCPEGWYYRIDPDNTVYLQPKSGTSDNKFYIGKHTKVLAKKRKIENLINRVLFIGDGIYRVYEDASSIALYGIYEHKIIDQRVSLVSTAEIMSQRVIQASKDPEISMRIMVSDDNGPSLHRGYDLESIKPGQTLQTFDPVSPILQILSVQYQADTMILEASSRIPVVAKRVEDIRRNFELYQTASNPSLPTAL